MPGEMDLLAAALARHQAGELEAAEQGYRGVLARDPRQVKAWKMLGVLARDAGRVSQAIECLEAALECAGPEPRLYFHLGQTYASAGDLDGAIRAYRQSLTVDEAAPTVHYALALVLVRRGFLREAIEHFCRSLDLDPTADSTHFKLAATLAADGQTGTAETAYRRLLDRWPNHAPACSNLGTLLQEQGRIDEAMDCYHRAIASDSQCAEAHFNLGTALALRKSFEQSAAALEHALRLRPDFAEGHCRLGDSLAAQGKLDAARQQFGKAARLRPGRLAWALQAEIVCPWIFADGGEIDAYRQGLGERLTALSQSKWDIDLDDIQAAGSPPPAALAYQGRDDKQLKAQYAGLFAGRLPLAEFKRGTGKPRVAFVVTPGHEAIFLRGMAGVLNRLDTGQMEITVTCGAAAKSRLATQIRNPQIEQWVLPTGISRAASALRTGRFDLVYFWEVGTDALNYFLPLMRTAPLQCTSWGWPVTSGIPEIDYFISSQRLEPAGAEQHYSERLVRLQQIPHFYSRPELRNVVAERSKFGFGPEHIYLCPQNPRKFHPDFDLLIGGILRADASGVFAMLAASPAYVSDQLQVRFARSMPDVAGRIRVLPRSTRADFLQLVATADVVLDTPHYGGGANTTYDILALGKPLVTLQGQFHRSRFASAVCQSIGLGELAAATADDYVEIARRLGTQPDARATWAARIGESAGALFDNRSAVIELQEFFLQAIERWPSGQTPSYQ